MPLEYEVYQGMPLRSSTPHLDEFLVIGYDTYIPLTDVWRITSMRQDLSLATGLTASF